MIKKNDDSNDIKKIITESDKAFKKDNYLGAIKLLNDSLKDDPSNMEIHYRLGIIYSKMGKHKEALKHFDTIVRDEYSFLHIGHVFTLKGFSESQINELKEAKASLTEALKYDSKNTVALTILGYIHYKAKEYEISLRIYNKLIELDENNYNVLNSIGYILIESEMDIDKGIELCKKAYELNPNSPAVLDSIGWGYYKKKDIKNSATYIKRAYEMSPNNDIIKFHLKSLVMFEDDSPK